MLTTEQIVEIAQEYREGVNVQVIAENVGCNTTTVNGVLHRLRQKGVDIPKRTRGAAFTEAVKILKK